MSKDCHVDTCKEENLPKGIKHPHSSQSTSTDPQRQADGDYAKKSRHKGGSEDGGYCTPAGDLASGQSPPGLGEVDRYLSDESRENIRDWMAYDEAQDLYCELDDDNSPDAEFIDLTLNPERYTGYKGKSAGLVWSSIYNENCFKSDPLSAGTGSYGAASAPASSTSSSGSGSASTNPFLSDLCLEKRIFYRMMSGLHTSIAVQIAAKHLLPESRAFKDLAQGKFGPDLGEFRRRFSPEYVPDAVERLRNLYFAYLVELRALAKAAPYLNEEEFYTGDTDGSGDETRDAVLQLLNTVRTFEKPFDESHLFAGNKREARKLKEEFRQRFLNVSRIMDCVGCDRCKLWGKVQIVGMGTAFKILFSGAAVGPESTVNAASKRHFQLRRAEIVALVNSLWRLSSSIQHVNTFRELLQKEETQSAFGAKVSAAGVGGGAGGGGKNSRGEL